MSAQEFTVKHPCGFVPQSILEKQKPQINQLIIIQHIKK